MVRFRCLAGLVVGIAATVVQLAPPAQAAEQRTTLESCTWVINELPLPTGWRSGYLTNSDRRDWFAGYGVDADGRTRALVWHAGEVTVLEAPGGLDATAVDVNSHGDVVGVIQDENTPTHGILWRDGQVIDLPVLPGGDGAVPSAINDAGLIVGSASDAEASHAVAWSANSPQTIRDLGVMTGSAYLTDVTEKGVVVGWTDSAGEDWREQAIAGTVRKGLRTLPGPLPGTNSTARAAAGSYIVGGAALPEAPQDPPGAVIWEPSGPRALPGINASAHAVNDYGTVAGTNAALAPVIWVGDDEQPLPALAGDSFSTSASVITNDNTAAGSSADAQGHSRPVTWSCTS
jgi:probable HAF family extracellular repeat protein